MAKFIFTVRSTQMEAFQYPRCSNGWETLVKGENCSLLAHTQVFITDHTYITENTLQQGLLL